MGASGVGKTTCLDVLAQRKNIGVLTGDVLVDGRPLTSDFARMTAYGMLYTLHTPRLSHVLRSRTNGRSRGHGYGS